MAKVKKEDGWQVIDTVTDAKLTEGNYGEYEYEVDNPGIYRYFRLQIRTKESSEGNEDGSLQLAEYELLGIATDKLPGNVISIDNGSGGFNEEESEESLFDGSTETKWCVTKDMQSVPDGEDKKCWWADFHEEQDVTVNSYTLRPGFDSNNYPGRNPRSWVLKAKSSEEDDWKIIDTVTDDLTMESLDIKEYSYAVDEPGIYRYFRLMVLSSWTDDILQLSEMKLSAEESTSDNKSMTRPELTDIQEAEVDGNYAYMYYGSYQDEPVKFRVLHVMQDDGVLLDCDKIMYKYDLGEGLLKGYKRAEKEALAKFHVGGSCGTRMTTGWMAKSVSSNGSFIGWLVDFGYNRNYYGNEYIKPLSAGELAYYYGLGHGNREFNGYSCPPDSIYKDGDWEIRSFFSKTSYGDEDDFMGYTMASRNYWDGGVRPDSCQNSSPACVIGMKSILFTSLVSGEVSAPRAEYKLTLKDDTIKITDNDTTAMVNGNKVRVSYNVALEEDNPGVSQVSVVMLDKKYTKGNSNEAKLMYYTKLSDITGAGNGNASFTLPDNYIPNWKTYIVAEKIRGEHETDFSSLPFLITLNVDVSIAGSVFSKSKMGILIGAVVLFAAAAMLGVRSRKKEDINV